MRTILHKKRAAIKSIWQPSREKSESPTLIYPVFAGRSRAFVVLFMRTYISQGAIPLAAAGANMIMTVFAGIETTQDPMGKAAPIRTNSAARPLPWGVQAVKGRKEKP